MPGGHVAFMISPENTNLEEDVDNLLPVMFVKFRSTVSEKAKMAQPIRGRSGHLVFFSDQHEKHKLVRLRWDLVSCKVSLNSVQRRSKKCLSQIEAGRSSCFSDRPENTNLEDDVKILLPCKFRWIRSAVSEEKSKCLIQSEVRPAILFFFPIGPKKTW